MADKPEFNEDLMPARQPPELSMIELSERHMAFAALRWPDSSDKMRAYRMRQAIWVRFENRKPHPDDPTRRKVGGPQPNSGRRVQKRIGEAIVEHFEHRQKEVLDAIAAPLNSDSGATAMERHKAGMNIAKHAREERAMEIVEDDYARRTDDDVTREAASVIAEMIRKGEIKLEDIIEGTAVEIDEDGKQLAA